VVIVTFCLRLKPVDDGRLVHVGKRPIAVNATLRGLMSW
jgi:hypothetical protein